MGFPNKWYGNLTLDNADQIAEHFREVLTGKRYTFVAINELTGMRPEVRTSQRLKDYGEPVYVNCSENYVSVGVRDSYGWWGISSTNKDPNARDDYQTPYLVFDDGKIIIEHRAPGGNRLTWVVAVEEDHE